MRNTIGHYIDSLPSEAKDVIVTAPVETWCVGLPVLNDDHDDRKYKCFGCGKVWVSEGADA